MFFAHHPVVGVPVVVGAAGCGEDLTKDHPQPLIVHVGMRVVGSDQLGGPFDSGPAPTVAGGDRGAWIGAQVAEFAGAADSYQRDDRFVGQRVREDSGVDDGGLSAAVTPQRGEYDKPLVGRGKVSEGGKVGHTRFSPGTTRYIPYS